MADTNGVKEAVRIKVEPKSLSIKVEPKSPSIKVEQKLPLQFAPSSQSTVLKAGPDEKPRGHLWGQNPFSLQSRQYLKPKSTGVSSSNRFSALKETDEAKLSTNPPAGKKRATRKERKRLSWTKPVKKKKDISDAALDKIVDAINDVDVKDMCKFVDFKKNNAALNNGGSKGGANATVKTKKIENSRKRRRRLNKRQKAALKKNNEGTDANTKTNKSARNSTQATANTGSQKQGNADTTGKKKKKILRKKKKTGQKQDNQGEESARTDNSHPANKAQNGESMETSENTDVAGKKKKKRKRKKPGQNQGEESTEASKTQNYENMENTNANKPEKKKKNRRGKKWKNKRSTENSEVGAANPETSTKNNSANMECSEEDDSPQPAKKIKIIHNITPKSTSIYNLSSPKLNPAYGKNRQQDIYASWQGDKSKSHVWKDTKTEVIKSPFTCCYMPAFLDDPSYLNKVKEELMSLELITKNNDLYKFHQTNDLKSVTSPHIAGLRHFLYGEFREWLIQVTGIPLNSTVDMGCSRYEYTDTLLCHDDELEGRRIAYILYLVPPWSKEDGGTLDLFNTDKHGQPNTIVRSLVPEWNAFAFFEVSPVSFHQVSEVLSQDKVRLSINGWFHGPPIERPERYTNPPPSTLYPGHIEEEEIYAWVNHLYLDQESQREIRRKFRKESALELDNFITEDKYEELAQAFRSAELSWKRIGPANKQNCEILDIEGTPEVIRNCADLLKSEALFLILSQLTGLKFHNLAPPDSEPDSDDDEEQAPNPRSSLSLHRWGPGSYTLVRDDCVEGKSALDVQLFVNVAEKWSLENGGFLSYITMDQDEELLTVSPRPNCLVLVYRDPQTLRFTKHINASVRELGDDNAAYHSLSGVYYE